MTQVSVDRLRALHAASAIVEVHPDDGQAWLTYGESLAMLGEYVAARGALLEALDLLPGSTEVASALAGVEMAQGRWHDALGRLADVLERDPLHGRALRLLAEIAAQHAGDPLPPSAMVSASLAAPLVELAKRLAAERQWDEALFAVRLALSTQPEDAHVINDLGCLLLLWVSDVDVGRRMLLPALHEAMHVFLRAIGKDPNFFLAYRNLATLLKNLASRNVKGAGRAADYCVMRDFELNPDKSCQRIAVADLLFCQRRLAEAAAAHCGEWESDGTLVPVSALTDFVTAFDRGMDRFHRADCLPPGAGRRAALVAAGEDFRDMGMGNEAALMFGIVLKETPDDAYLRGQVGELVASRWLLHQAVGLSMDDPQIGPPPLVMDWPRQTVGTPVVDVSP